MTKWFEQIRVVPRTIVTGLLMVCMLLALQTANGFSLLGNEPEFLDPQDVFQVQPVQSDGDALVASTQVAEGYYVYRRSLELEDVNGEPIELTVSDGIMHNDEFFGDTEIYTGDALNLALVAGATGPVTLHWQGCADAGICYPPQTMTLDLPADAAPASGVPAVAQSGPSTASSAAAVTATTRDGASMGEDQAAAHRLASLGPVTGALLFLGFGLLLAFTPCSLPMIPIVSTMVVGSGAAPRRATLLTLIYVLAMAATYAAVGVAAGLAGANLQAALQSPWLLGSFAALFLLLAISLFGAFELQLPAWLSARLDAAGRKQTGGSLSGAAGLGFLSALLVGPCMTAPLAGALLYIGQSGNAVMGGVALFALGLGMGLPLLAIGAFGPRILPKPGVWMDRVRVAFGFVMVAMAVYFLSRFLPANVSLLLWGALGLGVTVGLFGWTHALTLQRRSGWSVAFGAALVGLWSVMMLAGAASGGDSPLRPLAHLAAARQAPTQTDVVPVRYVDVKSADDVRARLQEAGGRGQWTLIDFYADWCVSCHVNEKYVFGDPAVAAQLTQLQVLRPDVTRNDSVDRELLKSWQVLGPPTMILVGPDGKEARGQRMVGELSAKDFMQRLNAAGVTL